MYYFIELAGSITNIALLSLFMSRLFVRNRIQSKWHYAFLALLCTGPVSYTHLVSNSMTELYTVMRYLRCKLNGGGGLAKGGGPAVKVGQLLLLQGAVLEVAHDLSLIHIFSISTFIVVMIIAIILLIRKWLHWRNSK